MGYYFGSGENSFGCAWNGSRWNEMADPVRVMKVFAGAD